MSRVSEIEPPSRNEKGNPTVRCLQIQWGWITPGTNLSNRRRQGMVHLRALAEDSLPATRHFLFTHCGWWLDRTMPAEVRKIYAENPEPFRALVPAAPGYLRKLSRFVKSGRLEYINYPYAACVAEATSGEGLLRAFRFSRDIAKRLFGHAPRVCMNHDAVYGLDWAAVQMPQIARLLGAEWVVSGKNGTVSAPDGTEIGTFGFERSFYEMAKDPHSLHSPRVFCMEMHEHVRHVREFHGGRHFFASRLGIDVEAITLDEYLAARNGECRRWPATAVGSKGWYGGVLDSLLIEQWAKTAELRLPAIEAGAFQAGDSEFSKEAETLWKQSFVLMDNHLLWQCHRYRPQFTGAARRLAGSVEKAEAAALSTRSRAWSIFNAVPWKRDVVQVAEGRDILVPGIAGWGTKPLAAGDVREFPHRRSEPKLALAAGGGVRFALGNHGQVQRILAKDYAAEGEGWGVLRALVETKASGAREWKAGDLPWPHAGCASLETLVDLSTTRCFEGVLHLGEILGDAYLLKVERLDLLGNVFSTDWHNLRSLHWVGSGMPQAHSHPAPVPLKLTYAARLRLTIWAASESALCLDGAKIQFTKTRGGFLPITHWTIRPLTSFQFVAPERVKARVVRESGASKLLRFSGRLGPGAFDLFAEADVTSPVVKYRLALRYDEPADLGVTTPPFGAMEGSLFGAQCERPYLPGVMVEFPVAAGASYFADKPYYIQRVLDAPQQTWHTDRRNWWMGLSPFIGMNLAIAEGKRDSLAVLTRGLKHFYRRQTGDEELLGLSFGATLIHPATQGHTVRPESPMFPLIGRMENDPYFETPFHRARGTYQFDYAFCPGLGASGFAVRSRFWREAQGFALPASRIRRGAQDSLPGVSASSEFVVPTALEPSDGGFRMRVVNLSPRAQKCTLRLPRPVKSVDGEARLKSPREAVVSLGPWAVREWAFQE